MNFTSSEAEFQFDSAVAAVAMLDAILAALAEAPDEFRRVGLIEAARMAACLIDQAVGDLEP